MDIQTKEFRTYVEAGAKWIAEHPDSSLGTTKVTDDFDSFCDALAATSNGVIPWENIGLILHHSQILHKIGTERYEEKLKVLDTPVYRFKPVSVKI